MLDARQLEALAAVVEHGGFGAAAQALSITLAAVSLRIKALEESLGQRLLVRGKQVRATPAGQALLAHIKQVRMMEADVLGGLQGTSSQSSARKAVRWQSLSVAINADSVDSWFLPGVAAMLLRHHVLLDIMIDDQDHTHDALKSGDVMGCVTTLAEPMRGCVAEPLGLMRYRCVAAPAVLKRCHTSAAAVSVHKLLTQPAVIFNRKDALQDTFLGQHFGPITRATLPLPWARLRPPSSWAWAGAWCPSSTWPNAQRCKNCCRAPRWMWPCIGSTGRAKPHQRSA